MDVKTAIQRGDAVALRGLLAEDPARANQLIEWGKAGEIHSHPLHYVSDMLFDGTLEKGRELTLIDALLENGSDPNHQAPGGETPLIGAASLGAESVGLRLIEAGGRPELRGKFQETALHWAANLGLLQLVTRLVEKGSDVNLKDGRYKSIPLGWALYGRFSQPTGGQNHHLEVIAFLVKAGASVEPSWLAQEQVLADPALLAALRG